MSKTSSSKKFWNGLDHPPTTLSWFMLQFQTRIWGRSENWDVTTSFHFYHLFTSSWFVPPVWIMSLNILSFFDVTPKLLSRLKRSCFFNCYIPTFTFLRKIKQLLITQKWVFSVFPYIWFFLLNTLWAITLVLVLAQVFEIGTLSLF